MSSYHKEDKDVFRIPFTADEVKQLERLEFKNPHSKPHHENGSVYELSILINAWQDNETELDIQITKWNGDKVLAVGEQNGEELFTLQGPFDIVFGKLEPIIPQLLQREKIQHSKNMELWNKEDELPPDPNQRFKMSEYIQSLQEGLKDEIEVIPAKREDVAQFVQKHYLHKFPAGTQLIYMVNRKTSDGASQPIGMALYGAPFPTATKFLEPEVSHQDTIELKRLFFDDIGVKNLESFVIAKTLKKIKEDKPNIKVVITFADDLQGHKGTIYQATNAIYLGKSDSGKHKYVYIIRGDAKEIKAKLQPQEYPKKEV